MEILVRRNRGVGSATPPFWYIFKIENCCNDKKTIEIKFFNVFLWSEIIAKDLLIDYVGS